MSRRQNAAVALLALALIALLFPRDCVRLVRDPGVDDGSCSSTIGLSWPNPEIAYVVLAAVAVATVVGLLLTARRNRPN